MPIAFKGQRLKVMIVSDDEISDGEVQIYLPTMKREWLRLPECA